MRASERSELVTTSVDDIYMRVLTPSHLLRSVQDEPTTASKSSARTLICYAQRRAASTVARVGGTATGLRERAIATRRKTKISLKLAA